MSNENIFTLAYTPEFMRVTCKECDKSLAMPFNSQARDVENLFRDFRSEHEALHDVYYDPGKVHRVRRAKR